MTITQTKRLSIEEVNLSDVSFIFQLLNSPNWIQHIGDRGISTNLHAEQYIVNSLIKSYQEKKFGLYKMVLKTDDQPIGICGLLKRDYLDVPDIGFAVLPDFEGNGYTSEAGIAILDDARARLGIEKVQAITSPGNFGSQHVLKKIGLRMIDTIRPGEEELLLFGN